MKKVWRLFALVVLALLLAPALFGEATLERATEEGAGVSKLITLHAAARGNPWINLRDGVDLPIAYARYPVAASRAPGLEQDLEQNQAQPLVLAAGDFNEDGVPDLIPGEACSPRRALRRQMGRS